MPTQHKYRHNTNNHASETQKFYNIKYLKQPKKPRFGRLFQVSTFGLELVS